MTNLTSSSWAKIILIALLCLVLCAGVGGCMVGVQSGIQTALGLFDSHYRFADDAELQNVGQADIPAESVRDLEIAWLAGSVEVRAVDDELAGGMIQTQEVAQDDSTVISEGRKMRWALNGERLSIAYGGRMFGFGGLASCTPGSAKKLVITLPQSCAQNLRSVDIAAASGLYKVKDLACECLSVDIASGELETMAIRANQLELNMASGQAHLQGLFPGVINVDQASGNTSITCLEQCPSLVSLSVMSGNTQLLVPQGSGYTVSCDKLSGMVDCPGTTQQGDSFKAGDGSASFVVDMTSGNVRVAQWD